MDHSRRRSSRRNSPPSVTLAAVIATALVVLAPGTGSAYPARFGAPFTSLEACIAPTEVFDVLIGDWNGDGRRDLAVGCTGGPGGKVSIFLGTGVGTFLPGEDLAYGVSSMLGIAAADMQGDGIADILATNQPDQVLVVLKIGSGFPVIHTQTTGTGPRELAAGDLNHDGKMDVVTANNGGNSISVLLGNGDGTLAPKTDYATGSEPTGIALGDLNGDGHLDVVTANYASSTITIWRGTGTGAFGNRSDLGAATEQPHDIILVPLNGDTLLDIVTCGIDYAQPGLSVWLGTGGGAFSTSALVPGVISSRIGAGDFNGDGNQDILVANAGLDTQVGTLWATTGDGLIHLGDGTGTFGSAVRFESGGFPFGVTAGDLNGDSDPDVVFASWKHDISITLGQGDGTFGVARSTNTGLQTQTDLVVVDMTGDMKPDLVHLNDDPVSGWVGVLAGDGTGGFSPGFSSSTPAGTGSMSITVADFDADGGRDVAVARTDYLVSSIKNLGGSSGFDLPVLTPLDSSPASIAAGDLNHDGKPELVTGNIAGIGDVSVLLNSGTGSFSSLGDFSFQATPGFGVAAVGIADMDSDTHPDVIVVGEAQFAGILYGDGTGSLGANTQFSVGDNPRALALADFDSNGFPDIAVACEGEVSVIANVGAGTFGPPQHYGVSGDHVGIVTGDVNQDGMIDIAVTNKDEGTVSVLLGHGDNTFQTSQLRWGSGFHVSSIAIADGTVDGLPDLYTVEPYYVQELLNLGATAPYDPAPTVRAPRVAFVEVGGTLAFDITATDLNGDFITSLTANSLPEGATFAPNGMNSTGTFSWSPGPGLEGTYAVDFVASNASSGNALTYLKVRPAGTSITGTLLWTPDNGASGTYLVCFGASGAGGSATSCTYITVNPSGLSAALPGRPNGGPAPAARAAASGQPVLQVPATATIVEGQTLALDVSVSNATTLTVDTSALPANSGATFAVDNDPAVTAPTVVHGTPGTPIAFLVSSVDPDGTSGTLTTVDLSAFPPGNLPSFDPTAGMFEFHWTPAAADDGKAFGVTFHAANALVGSAPTLIQVGARPAAYYKLNGTLNEESGGTPLAPLPAASASYATGQMGFGANFDGSASHAIGAVADSSLDFGPGFTAECWVKVRPPVPAQGSLLLIARYPTAIFNLWPNWNFEVLGTGPSTGKARFNFETALASSMAETQVRIDDGSFHHLAATYDGTSIRLYLDGDLQATIGASALSLEVTGGLLQVGGGTRTLTTTTYLDGVVDEVRVWRMTRSLSDIDGSKDSELFATVTGAETTTPVRRFTLAQNSPNPFNPETLIRYETTRESRVTLRVFDRSGRCLRTLVNAAMPPGQHRVRWDGRDAFGQPVASGVYFYRVDAGEFTASRKMILLK